MNWFNSNNEMDLLMDEPAKEYARKLKSVDGLSGLVDVYYKSLPETERLLLMEFVLYGLASFSQLNRIAIDSGMLFKDLFSSVFSAEDEDEDEGFSAN